MKLKNYFNLLKNEQEGSIVVMTAIFLVVLLGISAFVLDFGLTYHSTSKLQNALDSSALAAVRELPAADTSDPKWKKAKQAAKDYAALNGLDNVEMMVFEPIVKNGKITGIKVGGNTDVKYNFAKIFGSNSALVERSATAELKVISGIEGLLPVAITTEGMEKIKSGTITTIKYGEENDQLFKPGWRGAINFLDDDGSTAADGKFKDAMQSGGYHGLVEIDDLVYLNPGVMNESSMENLRNIIAIIPIVDIEEDDGDNNDDKDKKDKDKKDKYLKVVGFASIYIEDADSKTLIASYVSSNVVAGTALTDKDAVDYGVYTARLTD